jgi:hypothetical protein
MTNHFIRVNEKGEVIHRFSDKFETPQPGDICIRKNTCRHFYFDENGKRKTNPTLALSIKNNKMSEYNIKYKWDKNKVKRIDTDTVIQTPKPEALELSVSIEAEPPLISKAIGKFKNLLNLS